MPAIIAIAQMDDGKVFPMFVEQGQTLELAGAVDAQYIANEIDEQILERMTEAQLYSFTSALGYLPGAIPQENNVQSKTDIVRFLLAKWSEFFADYGDDDDENDEDASPLTSDERIVG